MIGRRAGAALLLGHGLAHLIGVALLWNLGEPGWLRSVDLSPVPGSAAGLAVGALWLVAAAGFVAAGGAVLTGRPWWRVTLGAVVVSCAALLPSAQAAAAGLVVDWLTMVVAIMAGARSVAPVPGRSAAAEVGAGLPRST